MRYDYWTDNSLQELHESIKMCLEKDDNTPEGKDKPNGVRELSGWNEHLFGIEDELNKRNIKYTKLDISEKKINFIPVEIILYDKIKELLLFEDNLSKDIEKKYSVREDTIWKEQADLLEEKLNDKNYKFSKINW